MSIQDITVKVADAHSIGSVNAILNEVATRLRNFVAGGESSLIDLKSLPFSPDEYEGLRSMLGRGEVTAQLDSIGDSEIYETHFPGVWWVTHYNVEGDIVADMLEITTIPEIFKSQHDDINTGLELLRAQLNDEVQP